MFPVVKRERYKVECLLLIGQKNIARNLIFELWQKSMKMNLYEFFNHKSYHTIMKDFQPNNNQINQMLLQAYN